MIDRLEGWSFAVHDSGIVLQSRVGRIRYREQLRPLRRARALVAALPAPPAWSSDGDWAIERALTHEHEHAALATRDGRLGEQPSRWAVGVVLLDDSCALVEGVAAAPEHRDALARTVRELTVGDTHMLGERRRRFVFAPPPWRGLLVAPHHAYFLAPGFPLCGVYAVVFPALPRMLFPGDASALVGALNRAKGWSHGALRSVANDVQNPNGLGGEIFEADVREGKVEAMRLYAVLEDRRYYYPLVLEAPPARMSEVVPVFRDVVASVEPIPGAARGPAVSHWVE